MSTTVKRTGRTGQLAKVTLGNNRRKVQSMVGSKKVSQSFYKRKTTLLEKAKEINEATGAECLLYLKSVGGTEYVYRSPTVEFDLEHLRTQKEEVTKEGDSTGPSFSFSPSTTVSKETQTTESSFTSVQDLTLCRICGEGREDTKALWVGCSHVRILGKVKQTCEYWVHAMCLGIAATSKAPFSRIGWKCPFHISIHKKNHIK